MVGKSVSQYRILEKLGGGGTLIVSSMSATERSNATKPSSKWLLEGSR
jgi:hypothetical protein